MVLASRSGSCGAFLKSREYQAETRKFKKQRKRYISSTVSSLSFGIGKFDKLIIELDSAISLMDFLNLQVGISTVSRLDTPKIK